jgi:hypothetical protein
MKQPRARRAWRKAQAYVRSGRHAKAEYWLRRTREILHGEQPPRWRLQDWDIGYFFVGLFVLAVLMVWIGSR